ncbi:helix-turn-helix domain-containing protein [Janthinobacterium sp. J1-1]|jgi:DNA-binding CsgD family transcriptional regulator|uniref:helix-turn-helix domain-containing protein n=1 Tax=unclassified Janthinobacterium TaxID=2610881 RepID=UPI002810D678|nr:helix-turn-helix transcriptional regulator [Janthinobacterium sp. J1-1]
MAIAVSSTSPSSLTPAERQVAVMAAEGAAYKTIAKVLGKSPATVRNQLHAVYRKLDVANRTALACKLRGES